MNTTLYNGVSGIRTHQFGLDSTSNNIANINTTGYRANLPEFKSLFANALNLANPHTPVKSDMNYGSTRASNAISNNDGSYKESDEEFSVAYAGKGWFVVGDNENTNFKGDVQKGVYFTRDGSFSRDAEGYVVNSAGYYMLGVDLGKIKDGVFISNSENDEENLAVGEIKPLQIPQDLHYGPTETTRVALAVNLNSNKSEITTYKLFELENDKVDETALLNEDINALVVNIENFNAPTYGSGVIKITKNGETTEHTFNYGDFKTLGELKNAIAEKTGLTLDFVRDSEGNVDKNLILELMAKEPTAMSVTVEGRLFERLGIKGQKDLNNFNIPKFEDKKPYKANDLVNLNGAIFQRIETDGASNPLDDATSWILVDSVGVAEFDAEKYNNINELVAYDGKIYRKVGDGDEIPSEDSQIWDLIGEDVGMEISEFKDGESYPRNSFVDYNNHIYQKISDDGTSPNIAPDKDTANWKLINNETFLSDKIAVANYKTTTDIFNDSGDKLVIISQYILTSNAPENQVWEVKSGIYDKTGKVLLSEEVAHNITFDKDGVATSEPIELIYEDKVVSYTISGSPNKKSSNMSYVDSGVMDLDKDGTQKGELAHIGIDNDGIINLSFSNGITEKMGRVGVVAFVNDQGLQKVGGNLFEMSGYLRDGETALPASGAPLIGWDEKGALRFGQILHKYLETSNVNAADAMTDLIVYQRGYSMNAKAFTTGDDLIKEAINLKR